MDVEVIEPPVKSRKIKCTNVPPDLLDKNRAKQHFRQFGRVLRITIRLRSKSIIIEYDCTENAMMAILKGGEYMGHVFSVNWFESPVKRKRVKKDPDPDWVPDPEIQEELDAMAATGRDFFKKQYNLRPEAMVVDAVPVRQTAVKIKKALKKSWKTENTKKLKTKTKGITTKSKAWTPEQLELLDILKQPAFTAEEKFKVLDARDKLIRLRTKKQIDLKKTTHTVGTCPDMCPEKERLMREIQHQVALYEQDSSGKIMNPTLAVKQYSRSSADQEVPLAHDLRPVSVLQLTMGYLMHRIMNLCDTPDVNLAEWYHFLWDRTRSIRKDITQQELCCQGSVALLEQCARFHIHCSARLAGEDPSVFDQKINTENLTKCLQTLKYMYHDLSLKGESCPKEAEFRAYIILLNLNDGNFMWEVQQLKTEIQKSPEVKFALEVYSAIDKNNFVKFFKLVRSTGYLNACILLRYFVQVRTRALSTILKCYSPRAPYTQFALSELAELLAFEDMESAVDFIIAYGLYLNSEQTHVVLDRKSFQLPEIPYCLDRATNVVESKRKSSVGEVVYGGILPPPNFQDHVPYNSFNEEGVFVITSVLTDLLKMESVVPSSPDVSFEDQPDSLKLLAKAPQVSSANVFQQFNQLAKPAPGIFGAKAPFMPEDIKNTSHDPSLPFWSIKTEPPPSSNVKLDESLPQPVFGHKPRNDPSSSFKQFTFGQKSGEEQLKPNIFTEPPKLSIFGATKLNIFDQSKSSIFNKVSEVKQEDSRTTKSIFGAGLEATEGLKFKENKSTAIFAQKPFGPVAQTSTSIFRESNQIPQSTIGTSNAETKPSLIFDPVSTSSSSLTANQINLASTKPFAPVARMPLQSPRADLQEAERKRKEELERERKIQKEKQEKLQREIEEMKRKAELRKRQLEEEERRKEKERLERERKRLEEERQKARLLEIEHKLALEIKNSVKALMEDMLTKVEEKLKTERLQEISDNFKKHKMLLFIHKWRRKSATNKRKRQAMDQNPIWLPSRTTKEEAQQLFTETQNVALQNIKRYKLGKPLEVALPPKEEIPKMNIALIYRTLLRSYFRTYQRLQKEMFWKVTVSLPDFREFKVGLNHVVNVLTDIFEWKDRYGSTAIVGQYTGENCLSYAVEKKQGVHTVESNSSGLLFVSHEPNEFLIQRIEESLKKFPRFAYVPIAVIFVNNHTDAINAQGLGKALEANAHVTNYDILACKFTNAALVDAVQQSLVFLAESIDRPPPLELNLLKAYLDVHLAMELWKRIASYAAWNSTYRSCLKSPAVVVSLYNEAVDKLKDIALEKSCVEYPNFPDEFEKLLMDRNPSVLPCDYKYFPLFWKTDSYRLLLSKAINSLKLPKFSGTWPPTNTTEAKRDISAYCSQIFEEPCLPFYKIMAVILKYVGSALDFSKAKNILWTNVIEIIALEKLQEELFVVYNSKALAAYSTDEWFYLKNSAVEVEIKQLKLHEENSKKRKVPPMSDFTFLDDIDLDKLEKSLRDDNEVVSRKSAEMQELLDSVADLEESIEIQKLTCMKFKEHVQKALDISN